MPMEQINKIPIVVGVTGHRNIVEEDKPLLKRQIVEALSEIKDLCRSKDGTQDTPIIMLSGLAQGADMLCAEAAFDMGVPVYAVLPCAKESFILSFDDETEKNKLYAYIDRCARTIIAPDMEQNREWLIAHGSDESSYRYRQVGVYMAEHSHVMLALWDGKKPKTDYGCGTVEVIKFALENNFLSKDRLFKPGMINDSAVIWIKSRRMGSGEDADIKRQWLISKMAEADGTVYDDYIVANEAPQFLVDVISKTVDYNVAQAEVSVCENETVLWNDINELDDYHKNVRIHYAKADKLSYERNQKKYGAFMLALSVVAAIVASAFLIYDDASLPYMIFPCSAAVILLITLSTIGRKRKYHSNYIQYRAFAEALRIQFYVTLCMNEEESATNVCALYAWAQKVDMIWVQKAIQALDVVSVNDLSREIDRNKVKEIWIGTNRRPEGQLSYHSRKRVTNKQQQDKIERTSSALQIATIVAYFVILIFEVCAIILNACGVPFFWDGNAFGEISFRALAAIAVGTFAVISLLLSGYWGKQSFNRKTDDNVKMCKFYASAYSRWNEAARYSDEEFKEFIKEIAREEIVENGIWCSYVAENTLDINI